MSSKKKTLKERFENKQIVLCGGTLANVISINEEANKIVVKDTVTKKDKVIKVDNIEARGGKFFQKEVVKMSQSPEVEVVETAAETSEAVAEVETTEEVLCTQEELDEIAKQMVEGIKKIDREKMILTCQFCGHEYDADNGGLERPEDPADACEGCVALAENRLLKSGVPGHEITPSLIISWLVRFYGLVNTNLVVEVINTVNTNEEAVVSEKSCCSSAEKSNSCSGVNTFMDARRKIAELLISIATGRGYTAAIADETEECVYITFNTFGLELTALCGGFLVNVGEDGVVRKFEEFSPLDEIVSYFFEETSNGESEEDTEEEIEEMSEIDTLPLGSFHRLQNCKNEANNKKLVKVIEVDCSSDSIIYRVEDKSGKTYKVTESKLRPSAKAF